MAGFLRILRPCLGRRFWLHWRSRGAWRELHLGQLRRFRRAQGSPCRVLSGPFGRFNALKTALRRGRKLLKALPRPISKGPRGVYLGGLLVYTKAVPWYTPRQGRLPGVGQAEFRVLRWSRAGSRGCRAPALGRAPFTVRRFPTSDGAGIVGPEGSLRGNPAAGQRAGSEAMAVGHGPPPFILQAERIIGSGCLAAEVLAAAARPACSFAFRAASALASPAACPERYYRIPPRWCR